MLNKIIDVNASESERDRLLEQLIEINEYKHGSAKRFISFYGNYYAASFTIIAATAIAIICLFFIAQKGMKESPNSLINVFLVSGIAVWFLGSFADVFKMEENYKLNRTLYLEYINLDNQIDSFLATNSIFAGNDRDKLSDPPRIPTNSFILSVDEKMRELNKIHIDFDGETLINIRERSQLEIPSGPGN